MGTDTIFSLILLLCFASLGLTVVGIFFSVRKSQRLPVLLGLLVGVGLVASIAVPVLRKAESYLAGPETAAETGEAAPGTAEAEEAATPAIEPDSIGLREAEAQGLVQVSVTGYDLAAINLIVTLRSGFEQTVVIPAGTIFIAGSGSVQNMVVRSTQRVSLSRFGNPEVSLNVPAACINMHRDVPAESDNFRLSSAPAEGDLRKLLHLPDFQSQSFRIQQFAIWTITDNPSRGEYVGIGSYGFGSGPDDQEMKDIRSLFKKAGIDPAGYRALRS